MRILGVTVLALVLLLSGCVLGSKSSHSYSSGSSSYPTTPGTGTGSGGGSQTCLSVYAATLQDGSGLPLTSQQSVVLIEEIEQQISTHLVRYRQVGLTSPGAFGSVSWCAPGTQNWLYVVTTVDSTGNFYPSVVVPHPVSGETITVGGNGTLVLSPAETPAVINGTITSAPIATNWHVYPLIAIEDPQDPQRTMEIVLPTQWASVGGTSSADYGGAFGYTHANAACAPAQFCEQYSLQLPGRSPWVKASSGYLQAAVSPSYGLKAVSQGLNGVQNCSPNEVTKWTQSDGASMTVSPGATVTAPTIGFSGCF